MDYHNNEKVSAYFFPPSLADYDTTPRRSQRQMSVLKGHEI